MDIDLTTQLLSMRLAANQNAAQIAIVKKSHEMQMDLIAMLSEAVLAPPPEGQGLVLDKRA